MGLFISFEGPDGSGKSTQARLLVEALRSDGHAVAQTREPGGTPLGERVRGLLLEPEGPPLTPLVMALLVSASRSQLVTDVIRPALQSGRTVVCDRYAESTLAYQCFGFGLERTAVEDLTRIATGGLRPDRIVYVDIPPQVGLQRLTSRGAANRLDQAGIDFQARVRAGYLKLISEEPERWISVDGTGPEAGVHDQIMGALRPLLTTAEADK